MRFWQTVTVCSILAGSAVPSTPLHAVEFNPLQLLLTTIPQPTLFRVVQTLAHSTSPPAQPPANRWSPLLQQHRCLDLSATDTLQVLLASAGVIGGTGVGAELTPPNLDCAAAQQQPLPQLCPRMASQRGVTLANFDPATTSATPAADWYDGQWDTHNNPPARAWGIAPHQFDGHNVLRIENVTTRFDWEDDALLIGYSDGRHGLPQGDITEGSLGTGGAYANFHYAVFPLTAAAQTAYATLLGVLPAPLATDPPGMVARAANALMRCAKAPCAPQQQQAYRAMQYLLHLADGRLDRIGKADEAPPQQYHSTLPGAYWTKNDAGYDQCEWLDTATLAPVQSMAYRNFGIWDWDIDTNAACVGVLLFEGDGNALFLQRHGLDLIGDTDSPDDFVGLFTVCRAATTATNGLTLTNFSDDLSITFATGETSCNAHAPRI
ncbi:MAG: hypothetical protein HY696_10855 [Deltaproteobacteria bacterium]|nr:hypothetical protein [Deltaproteobacteria bacterium]